MKLVLILILSVFSLSSFSQYDWPPKGEENVDFYVNSKDKPDGLHYRTYGNGDIFYVGYFANGKPQANTEFWYYYEDPAGHPMSLHSIQADPKKISAVNYFTSGKVMSSGEYINQKKNGIWSFYSEEGIITSKETFTDDILDGESTIYYTSGKIFRVENYKNGIKEGPIVEYFESGKKKLEGSFKDGLRDGPIVYYQPSGKLDIEGKFQNGKKEGHWTKYNAKGRAEISTLYRSDVKVKERRDNGTFLDYYASGIPKEEYTYVNSQKDGPFTVWYDMGEWIREEVKMNDSGDLGFKEKLIGSQIERQGDYLDDLLEGDLTYYDENGRVIKIETYSEGVLISTRDN